MADDFDMGAGLGVAEHFEPGQAESARLIVAQHATDADDCADLPMMLGLTKGPDRAACRHCRGPLSLQTISGKCGLQDFCSAKCRDAATREGR